jgi:D-tyrosyl-tRNA(Tyr) deacylase
MRAVIQRVSGASVTVDREPVGAIDAGLLVLLGVGRHDTPQDSEYVVDKIVNLRIFPEADGRFDRSVLDIGGALLVVSQFTLYADTRKGRRPSFTDAAPPDIAKAQFDAAVERFRATGLTVETGRFQAMMDVALVNDGPVTITIDSAHRLHPRS